MENIGNGENENVMEPKVSTEESLVPSQPNVRRSTKRTRSSITPEEVAELLTSALAYGVDAGLTVMYDNEPDGVVLFVSRFKYENEKLQLA
jgi:hypothetical protein